MSDPFLLSAIGMTPPPPVIVTRDILAEPDQSNHNIPPFPPYPRPLPPDSNPTNPQPPDVSAPVAPSPPPEPPPNPPPPRPLPPDPEIPPAPPNIHPPPARTPTAAAAASGGDDNSSSEDSSSSEDTNTGDRGGNAIAEQQQAPEVVTVERDRSAPAAHARASGARAPLLAHGNQQQRLQPKKLRYTSDRYDEEDDQGGICCPFAWCCCPCCGAEASEPAKGASRGGGYGAIDVPSRARRDDRAQQRRGPP